MEDIFVECGESRNDLFTCCVVARTLQAVVVGAVADDGLWQALQEKQQGFGYRMIAKGFWPVVKEQVVLLPMVRKRPRAEHMPEGLPAY